jgi:monofunctional biosynthetic peptidoglycan transglycosylase
LASRTRGLFGRLVRVAIVLAAIPLLLTVAYRFVAPVSTPMLYRWATGETVRRDWVPLSAVSPAMLRTVIAAEDSNFCRHHGIDWDAVAEAMDEDRDSPRGASTIAMQTARNLFLWLGRDYVRKALEVPLAMWLDLVLGKRRVLEVYLNIAEWGPGIFGVEAASRRYFNRPASAITAQQAALLAAALPNPQARDPRAPGGRYLALANNIADRGTPDTRCISAR